MEAFSGFVSFKVYLNEDKYPPQWHNTHVDFLEDALGLAPLEIIKLMENNSQAFSLGSLSQLGESYTYLVDYLGGGR